MKYGLTLCCDASATAPPLGLAAHLHAAAPSATRLLGIAPLVGTTLHHWTHAPFAGIISQLSPTNYPHHQIRREGKEHARVVAQKVKVALLHLQTHAFLVPHAPECAMTQDMVETFLMILKYRNITAAAQSLYTSQSTVSHRLRLLEQEVGAQLFVRQKGHRTVEPAQAGEDFVELAERWMTLFHEMGRIEAGAARQNLAIGAPDLINA